jgi:hypothetical protein
MANIAPGRDVVPNVPDLLGGIGVRTMGADVAQETARENTVIVCSRVAKKRSGTLRTASLPVASDLIFNRVILRSFKVWLPPKY